MNQISAISVPLSNSIRSLTLEHNEIVALSSIRGLVSLPVLEHLSLRGNNISGVFLNRDEISFQFSPTLSSLDIAYNNISSWSFINDLPNVFPGLFSLRISNNPLYDQPVTRSKTTSIPGKPMTVDEAFMLTLARLASINTLNYSKISKPDRTNGEMYYLSLIGKELSASPQNEETNILSNHPRYKELCDKYGEPTIKRSTDEGNFGTVHPRSVAGRLVVFTFYLPRTLDCGDGPEIKKEQKCEIPKTLDIYRIKALVSRFFGLPPLTFKLIWETEEWDPEEQVHLFDDEWDSSGDEETKRENAIGKINSFENNPQKVLIRADGNKFIKREVELVDSTRQIGFWFDDNFKEARIRVEPIER